MFAGKLHSFVDGGVLGYIGFEELVETDSKKVLCKRLYAAQAETVDELVEQVKIADRTVKKLLG